MSTRYAIRAALLCLALACVAAGRQPRSIELFFREFTAEWIRGNPDLATSTRFFSGEEQRRLEQQLTPLTAEYRRGRVELAERGLRELRTFDRAALDDVQRVSADLMAWQLERIVAGERFSDYTFPFDQFRGANVRLVAFLTVNHPIAAAADAENYVARLAQVAPRMDEAIAEARRIAARVLIPPRFILQRTREQMQQFVEGPPAQNPFVSSLVEKMSGVTDLSESRREQLRARAERIVESEIYPSWRKAIALLEPLEATSTDAAGLWRVAGGPEAYEAALRDFTTTTLTADEVHEIGLREVDRLERQMDGVFRKLGRTEGSVGERVARLKEELRYPATEEGRAAIMADIERMMRDAEKRVEPQFDRRPTAPVVARPYPRFREASAAASYTPPALDGSRPGLFQMPLRQERMTRFALRTLVYHETVPGHHFQIALELENQAVPAFRRLRAFGGISAFSEGWGLYAERLAAESGWYDGDPEGLLGQLDAALFRARRLVVDTGLHAKRWSRQQAIDYGIAAAEVERYVVMPGQACSYMIGQLKLVELRDRARQALGPRFSIRQFHNTVLGTGSVPLGLLEEQVDRYIRSAQR